MPTIADSQKLTPSEAATFRQVLKLYDSKNYKKAIKSCDGILKKNPKHGESLCMKGLCLYMQADAKPKASANQSLDAKAKQEQEDLNNDVKEQGFELVRNGLRQNIRSYVCWHVFGIIHRSRGDHAEAVKSFLQALRIDPENLQILRDTSVLQIQLRDFQGLVKTRQTMLSLQSTVKSNWLGYCVAHFFCANYKLALAICDSYLSTLASRPTPNGGKVAVAKPKDDYERSEVLLFKARMLLMNGQADECLKFLDDPETPKITDSLSVLEVKAQVFLLNKKYEDAKSLFKALMKRNMDNLEYHAGFIATCVGENWNNVVSLNNNTSLEVDFLALVGLKCLGEYASGFKELDAFYQEKSNEFPKNWTIEVISLWLLSPENLEFENHLRKLLRRNLIKGVPNLFGFFKKLYLKSNSSQSEESKPSLEFSFDGTLTTKPQTAPKTPSDILTTAIEQVQTKVKVIERVIEEIIASLKDSKTFPGDDSEIQTPDVLIWAQFFQAQHTFHTKSAVEALDQLEEVLKACPTLVHLHLLKADFLKDLGRSTEATLAITKVRLMDLQDRFLNTKSAQLLLDSLHYKPNYHITDLTSEISQLQSAEEVLDLFTKQEGDERNNMNEMQVQWLSLAVGTVSSVGFDWTALKLSNGFGTIAATQNAVKTVIKNLAIGVKANKEILDYYNAFQLDQFDFHAYCLRKGTINAYVDFIAHEDNVKRHDHFISACTRYLSALVLIKHSSTQSLFKLGADESDKIKALELKLQDEKLDASHKKKLKQQLNKLKKSLKSKSTNTKQESKVSTTSNSKAKSRRRKIYTKDLDEFGLDNLSKLRNDTKAFDKELKAVVDDLHVYGTEHSKANIVLCDFYFSKGKILKATGYLKRASGKTSNSKVLARCLVLLDAMEKSKISTAIYRNWESNQTFIDIVDLNLDPKVKVVVLQLLTEILNAEDLPADKSKILEKLESQAKQGGLLQNALGITEVARVKRLLGLSSVKETYGEVKTAFEALSGQIESERSAMWEVEAVKVARVLLKCLIDLGVEIEDVKTFAKLVSGRFPQVPIFEMFAFQQEK